MPFWVALASQHDAKGSWEESKGVGTSWDELLGAWKKEKNEKECEVCGPILVSLTDQKPEMLEKKSRRNTVFLKQIAEQKRRKERWRANLLTDLGVHVK